MLYRKPSKRSWLTGALAWAGALALAPLLSGGLCFNGDPIPESETCRDPGPIEIESLELYDESGGAPLTDGQIMATVVGGQGISMLPFRIRASGASIPECMSQSTRVLNLAGDQVGSYERAVVTHPSGAEGSRTTREIWLWIEHQVWAEPAIRLQVEVGDVQAERLLWLPGVDQTPNVSALSASPTSIVTGDSIALTITLDRPAPAGGVLVELRDPSGTFTAASDANTPTTCSGCIAEVTFPVNEWEGEVELRAVQANEAGAQITAATPFLSETEDPLAISVRVRP